MFIELGVEEEGVVHYQLPVETPVRRPALMRRSISVGNLNFTDPRNEDVDEM